MLLNRWTQIQPDRVDVSVDSFEIQVWIDGRWILATDGQIEREGRADNQLAGKRAALDALEEHLNNMLQCVRFLRRG